MSSVDLAERLRRETKSLHTETERAGIMPAMLQGNLDRQSYCHLLRNLHAIYEALEAALARNSDHPVLQPLQIDGLLRSSAIRDDLNFLRGAAWPTDIELADAAARYVEQLEAISVHEPELLLAHSYVRYLGDLSGGQILRKIVARALKLDGQNGMSFFYFSEPGAEALAVKYRSGLKAIQVNDLMAIKITNEAKSAFSRHIALFNELASATA